MKNNSHRVAIYPVNVRSCSMAMCVIIGRMMNSVCVAMSTVEASHAISTNRCARIPRVTLSGSSPVVSSCPSVVVKAKTAHMNGQMQFPTMPTINHLLILSFSYSH